MRERTRHDERLVVVMTCAFCGRPFELVAQGDDVELRDRAAFLRVHRDCLTDVLAHGRADEP